MNKRTLTPLQGQLLEALRSGRYEQGQGSLRTRDDKFCCLGVACDVADPDGWTGGKEAGQNHRLGASHPGNTYDPETHMYSFLGAKLTEQFNIPVQSQLALAIANDDGVSFLSIADALEAWWLEGTLYTNPPGE